MKRSENSGVKGGIAIHKVCGDLLKRGYIPFLPTGEYYTPYDMLVVTNDQKVYKLQVKYITDGKLPAGTSGGYNGRKMYEPGDFDFYAVYLPDVDAVIYPNISFMGCTIASTPRKSAQPFWWYEDFLDFDNPTKKRNYVEFGLSLNEGRIYNSRRKCEHPTKDELQSLLWKIPTTTIATQYGVSDNAVARWAKQYDLKKPPRGFWTNRNKINTTVAEMD